MIEKSDHEKYVETTKAEWDKDSNRISFSLPKKEYEKAAWHYDYLTMLFYDSETGMFLTKPYMRETEKQMQAEYLSLNEWRELKELNKSMRDFTRHTFDLIGQKFGGIFSSPIMKIFLVIVVIIAIIIILITFFPQISEAIFPVVKSTVQTTGQVVQPITQNGVKPA